MISKLTMGHLNKNGQLKLLLTLFLAFMAAPGLMAQEQSSLGDRAKKLYGEYQYAKAAEIYEQLVDRKNPKLEHLEYLADCYRQMNKYEIAENWYVRVVEDEKSKPENLLRYAEVLKGNGKYVEAKKVFERYGEGTGRAEEVRGEILGCDSAIVWMANPTHHKLANQRSINTALAEFSPLVWNDSVYYVSESAAPSGKAVKKGTYGWTGNGFLGIAAAGRQSDGALEAFGKVDASFAKGSYHVGPIAADPVGKTLYVTRTYGGKEVKVERDGKKRYRTRNLELYIYTEQEGGWKEIPFAYNKVSEYSVGHAALSPDGSILYFVSDMPGGQGGTDIWYCERTADGSWAQPVNAGPVVNSAGDEMFPSILADGTLYFSSDGWIGMGNLDIFRSAGEKGSWEKPVNLGFPINSSADDFAFTVYSTEDYTDLGYISSNRKDGAGNDDIYSFSYARAIPKLVLRGTAYDKVNGQPLPEVRASLQDGQGKLLARTTGGGLGTFFFEVEPDTDYSLLGVKQGYIDGRASTSTAGLKGGDTLDVAIYLDRLSEGRIFRLENIYYDLDKSNIRPDAALVLDTLVATLRDNPDLKIELSSHTDSRASDSYNLALSQRRAQAAVDYLVKRGIARERLIAKGYGETKLVNECADGVSCTEEQHQMNRRTEFKVLSESSQVYADDGVLLDTLVQLQVREQDLVEGSTFRLEGIYFDFDKHNIRRDAALVLNGLTAIMREYPTLEIELSAHTDCRGSHAYNQSLSQRRAQSSVDYLVERGIAKGRMEAKGYGETRLVNRCSDGVACTSAEHQLNRRVEVKVLKR